MGLTSQDLDIVIPVIQKKLPNLVKLNLNNNNLKHVPHSLGSLHTVRILKLADNSLQTIPESLGNLLNLQKLHLQNNNLKSLNEAIVHLWSLNYLNLSNNNLKTLPDNIAHLKNIQKVVLYQNPISLNALLLLSHMRYSQRILHLEEALKDTLSKLLDKKSSEFRNIATLMENIFPGREIKEFEDFYDSLTKTNRGN